MGIQPPIIAIEPGNLLAFRTLDAAEEYIDPEDISADIYKIYDSRGILLEARSSFYPRSVQIVEKSSTFTADSGNEIELAKELRQFFGRIESHDVLVANYSLEDMIRIIVAKYLTY